MWFLVLLIIAVEAYNTYRLSTYQQQLKETAEDLTNLKEAMESELKKVRKTFRTGGGRARPPLGTSKRNNEQNNPIKVKSKAKEYWKEQGWERRNGSYHGYYRSPVQSFKGEIHKNWSGFDFWIFNLPKAVKNGNHGSCFVHKGGGKYLIHFSKPPKGLSDGIMAVERILRESLSSRLR